MSEKTAAYFSLAPFIGTAASIVILREPIAPGLVVAGVLMAAGAWLHLSERHEHGHAHEALAHNHTHTTTSTICTLTNPARTRPSRMCIGTSTRP